MVGLKLTAQIIKRKTNKMGMFDWISFEKNPPLPNNIDHVQKKCIEFFFNVDSFQTKDLDCDLTRYVINEEGELREKIYSAGRSHFYEIGGLIKVSKEIECYGIVDVLGEKYWLEYNLLLNDGIMEKISLSSWKKLEEND